MTDKKSDNDERIKLSSFQTGPFSYKENLAIFDYLISFLREARQRYSMTLIESFASFLPPAETVFSYLIDSLLFARNFFGWEHFDRMGVNPALSFPDAPRKYFGVEGQTEIYDGLPETRKAFKYKPSKRSPSEDLYEFFDLVLNSLLEISDDYLNNVEIRHHLKKFQTRPAGRGNSRSSLWSKYRKEIKSLRRQVSFWKRQAFKAGFRQSSGKKLRRNPN